MYNSKDNEVIEIESLGFTQMTDDEVRKFEEQMALDEDFRRFIREDRSAWNKGTGCK
jgi:predicted metal-dependent TIM-barrel fold hydrolase